MSYSKIAVVLTGLRCLGNHDSEYQEIVHLSEDHTLKELCQLIRGKAKYGHQFAAAKIMFQECVHPKWEWESEKEAKNELEATR